MKRSRVALILALMLSLTPLVSRADSSIPPPTSTDPDRSCSYKALSPYHLSELKPPQSCGMGRWIPERLYLRLYKDSLRGIDCAADIEAEKRKAVAAWLVKLDQARQTARLFREEAEASRAADSILSRALRVIGGTAAGGAVGLAGGGVLVATEQADLKTGLISGTVIGAAVGLVSSVVVEAMR